MRSPYQNLPAERFWRTAVSGQHPNALFNLYRKKFEIDRQMKIATAGSCFAQHISRHLKARGYIVLDKEPPPPGLSEPLSRKYGYNLYSARYGNIYHVRQLLQLVQEAFGARRPVNIVWEKNGRYFDALRPAVEPNGLSSPDAVNTHRTKHLSFVRAMFREANLFVFTLGLTESWTHTETGTVYPTAPGTVAGDYDSHIYSFKNFNSNEIISDLLEFREFIKSINPTLKFLFTVSPVPLTATATENHVLVATTYSKSVLRAAAGQMYETFDDVDYFPSYELIASPVSRGVYYECNLRSVREEGVATVMSTFFAEHDGGKPANLIESAPTNRLQDSPEAVACEEVILEAFSR